ncbi:cytochrome-c peroxidase [Flavivirga eckloniae]|uniref:Methylamine utilization protein n=1 Tax=Flavivirga eckloniae TaxID=1803846 RepID=A0A2K9PL17_9FLAO|nr:cytochrome c peroxidase [Flavivirga eckloniae]AUP77769.1 methylamine utilization protein [Flavivirga eckloniae]
MNNILFLIRAKAYTFSICLLLLTGTACKKEVANTKPVSISEQIENLYTTELSHCINALDSLALLKNTHDNIENYKKARLHFKSIEPILSFIDKDNYKSLNAPNILQIHEEDPTDIKIRNPFGFQVIEELLHEPQIDSLKIKETISITNSRLKLIKKNIHIDFKDHHIIWLLRNEIARIATTGITGYDSPVLSQSLQESQYAYTTLEKIITLSKDKFQSEALYQNILKAIAEAKQVLNHDFDSFDRYVFIKDHINTQLKLLVSMQKDWQVAFPFQLALSNNIISLFSAETLNADYFTDYKSDTTNLASKIAFGKTLFNDVNLSKNHDMACATCHIKEKAFTDGRRVFDDRQTRNSPTLTYATYQQAYFHDARTGSLEGQIVGVVNNHNEFNMTMDSIIVRVRKNPEYKRLLDSLYNNKRDDFNIRHSIASYVRTLSAFNSKFDRNINNQENTLTDNEIKGFNLFTGKAQCATCHFAPVFNGTIPPEYKETEMELIGVPQKNDTINATISEDLGRYYTYKTPERKHFFKTPTIRNIEKTGPYMHNGVYNTLEEIVDFYNRGGGAGIGINAELQTLPPDPLNLTQDEQNDLIAFMKTLTDNDLNETNN